MLNKVFIGIALLGVLIVGTIFPRSAPAPVSNIDQAGSVRIDQDQFVNGIGLGSTPTLQNSIRGTMGAGVNQVSFRNTLGKPIYVDFATVVNTGTASTTFTVDIATSSAATITNYTSPFSEIIDSAQLSTSTPAGKMINSIKNAGTNGTNVVKIDDGEYVVFMLSAGEPAQNGAPTCSGAVCETATSTNRGFNLDYFLHYFSK